MIGRELPIDHLRRFQLGEATAFRDLVTEFRDRLVQFFYRLSLDRDRAEDLCQDVFVKLMRVAPRYRPEGRLSVFVFRIANNLWVDHCRRAMPRPRFHSLDQVLLPDGESRAAEVADGQPGPSQQVADRDEQGHVILALARLTDPHRQAVELVVFQQLTYAEAAVVLQVPVGTVKSRVHLAIAALRQLVVEPQLRRLA